ncbi:MAG: ABC transporter permease [Thermodesulfovibrionales bacterium]|nr:ABC transporter permease [Thermodesulfovibrionales bacterium]
MTILKLALNNIKRRKTRSLLTLFGIAFSIAVFFSILSINKGFERELDRQLKKTGIHFMIVPSGCPYEVATLVLHGSILPQLLNADVLEKVRTTERLELVSPALVTQLPNPRAGRVDTIYGIDMADAFKIKPEWQIDGRLPADKFEILAGSAVANAYKLKPGDEITYTIENRRFKVAGILKETTTQDDAFVYMHIQTLQEIINKPQAVTAIFARAKDPAMLEDIIGDIYIKVTSVQIITMGEIIGSIMTIVSSAKSLGISIAVIVIFISAIGIINLMLTTVFEQTKEIGMIRAIGASRSDIFSMVINEAIVLSAIGGAAGIFLSVIFSPLIEKIVRNITPYVPGGRIVTFGYELAVLCFFFSIIIGAVSGLFPAWKASRLSPVEAIGG